MPTNKIQKVPQADVDFALQIDTANVRPSVAGAVVDGSVNQLQMNPGGKKLQLNGYRFEALASTVTAKTATAADSGTIYVTGTNVTVTLTLPATVEGLVFGLMTGVATSSGGHALSPNSADKFLAAGKADDADYVNSAATDVVGDLMIVQGDGADGWYVINKIGTWA